MRLPPMDRAEFDRLLAGDKDSWDRFVQGTFALIRAMAWRTLQAHRGYAYPDETDDIVQNVYVKLLHSDKALLRRYDPDKASLSTWISLIARSVTIDFLRKQKHHLPLNEAITPAEPSIQERGGETIDLPPGLLSGRQELILRLLFDKEMEPDEVASFLGIKTQTVRSAKHKAIEKLRKHYKETG
jgi:RNA polymerase sigma-70 factor (ECF subfamily)